MDKFFKGRKKSTSWDVIIEGLMVSNKAMFFAALYNAMMEHPSYVILSDMPCERKISILDNMVAYYELKEDYEKCANLVKIQKQVNNNLC